MSKYKLHYKATFWVEADLDSIEAKDRAIVLLHGAEPLEVLNQLDEEGYIVNTDPDIMEGTEEYISVNENDGQCTIEIVNEENELVWSNSYEETVKNKQ